jgi:hypothetical protein
MKGVPLIEKTKIRTLAVLSMIQVVLAAPIYIVCFGGKAYFEDMPSTVCQALLMIKTGTVGRHSRFPASFKYRLGGVFNLFVTIPLAPLQVVLIGAAEYWEDAPGTLAHLGSVFKSGETARSRRKREYAKQMNQA